LQAEYKIIPIGLLHSNCAFNKDSVKKVVMNRRSSYLFFLATLLTCTLYPHLPSNTLINDESQHPVSIGTLKTNDRIQSFDPITRTFPSTIIKATKNCIVQDLYRITTPNSVVIAGPNQPFFDLVRKKFIPAQAWSTSHVFVDDTLAAVETLGVEKVQGETSCCELYLDDHHIFFASDARVMTHNHPLVIVAAELGAILFEALPTLVALNCFADKTIQIAQKMKLSQPHIPASVITTTPPPLATAPILGKALPKLAAPANQVNIPKISIATTAAPQIAVPKIASAPRSSTKIVTQALEQAQTISQPITAQPANSTIAAGANMSTSIAPSMAAQSINSQAILQAAIPGTMLVGAIIYGLHCQAVNRRMLQAVAHEQEMLVHKHDTLDQHLQRLIEDAIRDGQVGNPHYNFRRFDAYRFPSHFNLLKQDSAYEKNILTLRDLLEKKCNDLSPYEISLLDNVDGMPHKQDWWGKVKNLLKATPRCKELLETQYSKDNGYSFTLDGKDLSITEVITNLANKVDNEQRLRLEQQLTDFFDTQEKTGRWKELSDLIRSAEQITTPCDITQDLPDNTWTGGPPDTTLNDLPHCGDTPFGDQPQIPQPPCDGAISRDGTPSSPGAPEGTTADQQPCGWSKQPQLPSLEEKAPNDKQQKIDQIVEFAKKYKGNAQPGYKGGAEFTNDGRKKSFILDQIDSTGKPITYKEYDVLPINNNKSRGAERLVIGSDGRVYYSADHYQTFIEIRK
jgi:guanyl-specific ribonuclease Sa